MNLAKHIESSPGFVLIFVLGVFLHNPQTQFVPQANHDPG